MTLQSIQKNYLLEFGCVLTSLLDSRMAFSIFLPLVLHGEWVTICCVCIQMRFTFVMICFVDEFFFFGISIYLEIKLSKGKLSLWFSDIQVIDWFVMFLSDIHFWWFLSLLRLIHFQVRFTFVFSILNWLNYMLRSKMLVFSLFSLI